jgi:hypothetical protein
MRGYGLLATNDVIFPRLLLRLPHTHGMRRDGSSATDHVTIVPFDIIIVVTVVNIAVVVERDVVIGIALAREVTPAPAGGGKERHERPEDAAACVHDVRIIPVPPQGRGVTAVIVIVTAMTSIASVVNVIRSSCPRGIADAPRARRITSPRRSRGRNLRCR